MNRVCPERKHEHEQERERGVAMAEYLFVVALIAVVCIFALTYFGDQLVALFGRLSDSIANA